MCRVLRLRFRDIGRAAVEDVTYQGGADECEVATGLLEHEPYTGETNVHSVHGSDYKHGLEAEHVVGVGNAWENGGHDWGEDKHTECANELINLAMADPLANWGTCDADASESLSDDAAFRSMYIERQVAVKTKSELSVTNPYVR